MARWTDQTAYPVLGELADDDRFPLLDVSDPSAEGGAQRQGTIGLLRALLGSALGDLSDVDTSGANDGDRLIYDAGTWVPGPPGDAPPANVTVRTVVTNDTPTDTDTGKRLNVTDEGVISLDDDLDDGAWFVVRAESDDPVSIDVTGTATMSPAGPLVLVPYTAALCTHLTGGAWQVEGAFEEGP